MNVCNIYQTVDIEIRKANKSSSTSGKSPHGDFTLVVLANSFFQFISHRIRSYDCQCISPTDGLSLTSMRFLNTTSPSTLFPTLICLVTANHGNTLASHGAPLRFQFKVSFQEHDQIVRSQTLLVTTHTFGMDSSLISRSCRRRSSRCRRLTSSSCRYRSFSSSVRTSSSRIPISKHRRSRHDEHRRICKYRIVRSFRSLLFTISALKSRCRHGRSSSYKHFLSSDDHQCRFNACLTSFRRAFRRKKAAMRWKRCERDVDWNVVAYLCKERKWVHRSSSQSIWIRIWRIGERKQAIVDHSNVYLSSSVQIWSPVISIR